VVSDANHQPGRKVGSKRRFQPLKLPWLRLRRAMGTPGCSEEIQDFLVLLEGWNVVRADDARPRAVRAHSSNRRPMANPSSCAGLPAEWN